MRTQPQLEERLLEFTRTEIFRGQGDIHLDTDLVAAGFDSLSLVGLLLFVEREYGTWLPENEITADVLKDLRSLAAHVRRHLP